MKLALLSLNNVILYEIDFIVLAECYDCVHCGPVEMGFIHLDGVILFTL